jgi:hypothetical protein
MLSFLRKQESTVSEVQIINLKRSKKKEMKKIITVIMLLTAAVMAAGTVHGASYNVDSKISIRAVIHTVDKGLIEAVWKKGSEDWTTDGNRVIWGHFYADPEDAGWGSPQNPDVFVKIWFDKSERIDVNFFHVSVPDIDVYSEYYGDKTLKGSGTTTMSRRYIRHTYNNGKLEKEEKYEDGTPPSGYTPAGSPSGYMTINDLKIGAIIHTVEKGFVDAVWRKGGGDCTTDGNQVIWGHFYADPDDVEWGSLSNPEVFVKIWFDASGRVDVNFFHVSVPDIEVYSDFPSDGTYNQKGTAILNNRYIRHEYRRSTNDKKSPVANFTAELTKKDAPYEVTLDASDSCDYDGDIVKYEWKSSAEPGKTWQGEILMLTLPTAGSYAFTLTVTDDDGLKDIQIQDAEIGGLPNPPSIGVKEILLTIEAPGEDCSIPPSAETAFDETDARVIVWVNYAYFEAGKQYEFKWYAPGVASPVHTYTSPPKNAVWDGCSWISIPVAMLQRYPSGTWRVEFYYDGEKHAEKDFYFQSDSPGTDFQIEDFIITDETDTDEECLKPGEQKSFDDTDTAASAWAYYRNFEAGKNYEFRWYTPKNALVYKNKGSFEESGDGGCLLGSIQTEVLRGYGSGEWRVEFYYDGKKYEQSDFTFTTSNTPLPFEVNQFLFTAESPNTKCEEPDSETVFDDTNAKVTVWVQYENFEGTKGPYRFVWESPDGQIAQETGDSSYYQETENLSAGCAWESMTAEQIGKYDPGQWHVKFYYAGEEYSEGYFTFNLTQPRPFSVTEFIFTLDTPSKDCDKVLNPGSSFDDTDDTVYARISHLDFQTGKSYQIKWYDPDKKLIHSHAGTPEENSERAGCIWSGVPTKRLRESGSGWWQVEFYYDGKFYRKESFYFTSSNPAKAFEAREFLMTGSYSQDNNCLTPASETVFNDTGAAAWVYYYFFEEGKFYDFKWYAPDNTLVQTSNRETQNVENLTSGCLWSSISAEKLREYGSGEWEVEFYYDGQLEKTATFTFETADTELEISKFVLTSERPGGNNNCTSPASETDFDDFDGDEGSVFAWVRYSRFEPRKSYWFKWYSPDNELVQESQPVVNNASNGCVWEGISLINLQKHRAGTWRVVFFYDGYNAAERNFTFTSRYSDTDFEITEFVLTTAYTEDCELPATQTSFSNSNAEVIAWVSYRNLKAGIPYAFKWYNPAGESVLTNSQQSGHGEDIRIGCTWAAIPKATLEQQEPGQWRVEFIYNNEKYGEKSFNFSYSQQSARIDLEHFFFTNQSPQDSCEAPEAETAFTDSDARVTAWVSYQYLESGSKSYQFKWYSPDNTLVLETDGVSEFHKKCVWESISMETLSLYDSGEWRVEFYYDGEKYSENKFTFSLTHPNDFRINDFFFTNAGLSDNCKDPPVSEDIFDDNNETVAAYVSHSGFQPGKMYEFRWFTSDNVMRYSEQGTHEDRETAQCSWRLIPTEKLREYGSDLWRAEFYYDGKSYGEKSFSFISGNPDKEFEVWDFRFTDHYSAADNCTPPVIEEGVGENDEGITAWIRYYFFEPGKSCHFRWYAPDNAMVQSGPNLQYGGLISGCMWSSIPIEKLREYGPGKWRAEFYYYDELQMTKQFTFKTVYEGVKIRDVILTGETPSEAECLPPEPETEFEDFDGDEVFAWILYSGFEAGTPYQFRWYSPNNVPAQVTSRDAKEAGSYENGCLWTGIPTETIKKYGSGKWRVEFFCDGEKKAERFFSFLFEEFQINNFVLTQAYSSQNNCEMPASRDRFTDTDTAGTAWISYDNFGNESRICQFIWYAPNGMTAKKTEIQVDSDTGCLWSTIPLETFAKYEPGQWRVAFYCDGKKYLEEKFTFALSPFSLEEFLFTDHEPSGDCQERPVSEMIFDDEDDTIFAWGAHSGFQSGKRYEFRWYNSDNIMGYISQGTHEDMQLNGCSWSGIPIEKLREYGSDLWRVEFYYDGPLYGEDNFYFNSGNPDQEFELSEFLFTAQHSQADNCEPPLSETVFNSNVPGIATWVRYYFFEPGTTYEFRWYAPDNTLVQSGIRELQETDSFKAGCLESEIPVEKLQEYGSGKWRTEFYYDNRLQRTEAFTFEADVKGPVIESFILTSETPSADNCISPVSETDFDRSGGESVFAWIRYQGFETDAAYQFKWYAPENVFVQETNPSAKSESDGRGCLWTEIPAMTLQRYRSGEWRVEFFYNREKKAERFFTFTSDYSDDFQIDSCILTDAYSGENNCEIPSSRNTFNDTDPEVIVWAGYRNFERGKFCKFIWYSPDGRPIQETEAVVQNDFVQGCVWGSISAETLTVYEPGQWRVEFYYDGKIYSEQTFSFSLSFKTEEFLFTLDTPSEECSAPSPGTLFVDKDGTVSAWVSHLNAEDGKEAEFRWYNPDDRISYSEKKQLDKNSDCSWSGMTTEKLREYGSGWWRVEFLYDGTAYDTTEFFFTSENPAKTFEVWNFLFTGISAETDTCQTPQPQTAFDDSDSDTVATAWVRYYFSEPGKTYDFRWYSPDNTLVQTNPQAFQETDSLNSGCLRSQINAEKLWENGSGEWRVEFYYDDQLYAEGAFTSGPLSEEYPQLLDFIMTAAYSQQDNCRIPAAQTVFSDTDAQVIIWMYYRYFRSGEPYEFRWYSPDGNLAQINPYLSDAKSEGCLWADISKAALKRYSQGQWRVEFVYNGRKLDEQVFEFQF